MMPATTSAVLNCDPAFMMKVAAPSRAVSISQITSAAGAEHDAPAQSADDRQQHRSLPRRQRHHHGIGDREKRDDRDRDGGQVRTEPEPQQQQRHQRDQRHGGERDEQRAEQPSEHRRDAGDETEQDAAGDGRQQAAQQDRRAGIDMLAVVCPTSRARAPGSRPSQRPAACWRLERRRTPRSTPRR